MSGSPVREKQAESQEFFVKVLFLLEYLIPLTKREGKILFNPCCGVHRRKARAVAIAEEILAFLKRLKREASLTHRDVELWSSGLLTMWALSCKGT